MNVLTNSTLVEIAKPGTLAPNGDPSEPVTVWTGAAKGYLKRSRRQTVSKGESVVVRRDTFTIMSTAGAPAIEQAGGDWEAYTVVIDDERTSSTQRRRFTVRGMENRAAGTIADSIRLELYGETTP